MARNKQKTHTPTHSQTESPLKFGPPSHKHPATPLLILNVKLTVPKVGLHFPLHTFSFGLHILVGLHA